MQLVAFEQTNGQKVWVNPEQVVSVRPGQRSEGGATDIVLTQGSLTVKGPIGEIASELNKGLKA